MNIKNNLILKEIIKFKINQIQVVLFLVNLLSKDLKREVEVIVRYFHHKKNILKATILLIIIILLGRNIIDKILNNIRIKRYQENLHKFIRQIKIKLKNQVVRKKIKIISL